MATTFTIEGNADDADRALDKFIGRLEKAETQSKETGRSVDKLGRSLDNSVTSARKSGLAMEFYTQRAHAASLASGNATKAGGRLGAQITSLSAKVLGLGSAIGISQAGIGSAVVAFGPLGVAVAAAGAAYIGLKSAIDSVTEAERKLADLDRQFLDDQLTRLNEISDKRRAAARERYDAELRFQALARQRVKEEAAGFRQLEEANRDRAEMERLIADRVEEFGKSRESIESRIRVITQQRNNLIREGQRIEGTGEVFDNNRRAIKLQLLRIEEETNALRRQGVDLERDAAQAVRDQAAAKRADEAERRKAAADLKKIQDDMDADAKAGLMILKQQTDERKAQLALLFQAKDANKPAGGGATGQTGGGRGGGIVGNLLGGAFGGVNAALGGASRQLGQSGVNLGGGGGGRDSSGLGVLDAAKMLTDSELARVAKRAGVDADIVDAMRAQLAAQAELDAQQEQMSRDQQQLKALADAILNKARGRRQRSGR